jgi:hypothetical protein
MYTAWWVEGVGDARRRDAMYNTVSGASPSAGTVTERSGSKNVEPFSVLWTWNATDRRNPYERGERNKHSSLHAHN